MTESAVDGTLHLDDIDEAPEDCRHLDGGLATEAQTIASLVSRAGETGYFLVDLDGTPVSEGSWEHQNRPTAKAWVEVDIDEDKARRLLDLVPNVVIVNTAFTFEPGGNVFDGLDASTAARIAALDLVDELRDAIATAHLAAWKVALTEAGFVPFECDEHMVETEIARGALDRKAIVDANEDLSPYWQTAWDAVDSAAIAQRLILAKGA